ncbi:double zinc ribbon domain-containing protein [Haloparvum sp. AD34]
MSKITFRADDDLVARLEGRQESKSEIMREALRSYLDESAAAESSDVDDVIDDRVGEVVDDRLDSALESRIDSMIDDRLDAALGDRFGRYPQKTPESGRDVNVNVSLDGVGGEVEGSTATASEESDRVETSAEETVDESADGVTSCDSCGESMPDDHVYCPNCGEKRSHRVFCECGDELRSDWSFCPGCGRRTPAADVLDTR